VSADGEKSRYTDVDRLSKQDVKAFLREMVIVREHVREAFAAHHLHGHTVRQAIGLVGACPIQRQSLQKLGAGSLDDTHTGVIEQPLDERHRFLTHDGPAALRAASIPSRRHRWSRRVLVEEGIAQGGHTGVPRVPPIQKREASRTYRQQSSHRYRFGVP